MNAGGGMQLARWPRCSCGRFTDQGLETCGRAECQRIALRDRDLAWHRRNLEGAIAYMLSRLEGGTRG